MTSRGQSNLVAALILILTGIASARYWWQIENSAEQLRDETLRQSTVRAKQVNDAVTDKISMLFFNIDSALKGFIEHYVPNDGAVFRAEVWRLEDRIPPSAAGAVLLITGSSTMSAPRMQSEPIRQSLCQSDLSI
jgi:hypothetical protein